MIAQGYDDNRIFGTLNQPYTTRMWRIGEILVLEGVCTCRRTAPAILRYRPPTCLVRLHHDKLSHIRSRMVVELEGYRVSEVGSGLKRRIDLEGSRSNQGQKTPEDESAKNLRIGGSTEYSQSRVVLFGATIDG